MNKQKTIIVLNCVAKKTADIRKSVNKRRLSRIKQTPVDIKEVTDDYEPVKLKVDKFINRISKRG